MPVPVEGSQLQEEEGENAVVEAGGGAGRGAAKGGATAGGEEGRLLLERAGAGLPAVGPKEVKESKDDCLFDRISRRQDQPCLHVSLSVQKVRILHPEHVVTGGAPGEGTGAPGEGAAGVPDEGAAGATGEGAGGAPGWGTR